MMVPKDVLVLALLAIRNYRQDPSEENREEAFYYIELIEGLEKYEKEGVQPLIPVLEKRQIATSVSEENIEQTPLELIPSVDKKIISLIPRPVYQLLSIVATALLTVVFLVLINERALFTPQPAASPIATPTIASTTMELTPLCGGSERYLGPAEDLGGFRRDLGVTVYLVENSNGNILSNTVRAVAVDERGVWFGYYPQGDSTPIGEVGQFDGQSWEHCISNIALIGQRTNDITIAENGNVWIVTDGYGASVFDGSQWRSFTTEQGLAHNQTYTVVTEGEIAWIGTWEGIAKFDGQDWSVPYSVQRGDSLVDNHVHAIALHPAGEIWVGYINAGISRFTRDGEWLHYSVNSASGELASDNIRGVVVDHNGALWFATDGGGISEFDFEAQEWTIYTTDNSNLPDNSVRAVAVDKYNRVWAATQGGVVYFDGSTWQLYSEISAYDIAFGPACSTCPYNDEHVWLGTTDLGLAHARIPPISEVIRVESIEYPREVAPGEQFNPRITVRVLPGYELDGGDGLFYSGRADFDLFGAYPIIPVREVVTVGQTYEFFDYEHPFTAPENPGTYTSVWRVWHNGRYVGPEIVIEYTVTTP